MNELDPEGLEPLDHALVCPDRYTPNMRRINEVHVENYLAWLEPPVATSTGPWLGHMANGHIHHEPQR